MFTSLWQRIKEVWRNMFGANDVKRAMDVTVQISPTMVEALRQWSAMYINEPDWKVAKGITPMGLPASIASEISRNATIEMQVEVKGSSARAKFLHEQIQPVVTALRHELEYGCAKGGLVMKPYVVDGRLEVDFIQADMFYPVGFRNKKLTEPIFSEQLQRGNDWYTRLEHHKPLPRKQYQIINKLFKSSSQSDLGGEVKLEEVDIWADLMPFVVLDSVTQPLFAYFKYPQANAIDPTSSLGVSCYSRAVSLIEEADVLFDRMLWDFESGERAMIVDELALEKGNDGTYKIPNKRLYRTLKGTGEIGKQELFKEWTPELREASHINGLDAILKRIEFNVGLAYGTLSDPQSVDKTATEIQASKQRSASTIVDMQKVIQTNIEELLYAMNVHCDIAGIAKGGKYEVLFKFDDSLITDKEKQFSQDSQAIGLLVMSKLEFRMRNYGETKEQAQKAIAEAEKDAPKEEMFPK